MAFSTLGSGTIRVIRKEESYAIAEGFVSKVAVGKSAIVKYDPATEKVEPVTALTDTPFGMVTSGTKDVADGEVTVLTPYSAIVIGKASAVVAAGDKLGVAAYDAITGVSEYQIQTAGNFVVGIALQDALAIGDTFQVGIYRTFGEVVA